MSPFLPWATTFAVSGGALVMGRSLSESNQPQQLAREIKISLRELSLEIQRSIRTCLIPLQASQEGVAQEALVQLQERMGMSHHPIWRAITGVLSGL